MRGTRVDYKNPDHIHIIYFGSFISGAAANEFDMSEKDFLNLYAQMGKVIAKIEERVKVEWEEHTKKFDKKYNREWKEAKDE